jgi:hypothetical protein
MPKLIVPSIGGGTKLMRAFLAGEAEGVCSGAAGGVVDPSGGIDRAGDSSGDAGDVGVGDSCAAAIEAKMAARNARLTLVVMSSEVSRCCGIIFLREFREIPRLRSE